MKIKLFAILLVAVLCSGLVIGVSAAAGAELYDEAQLLSVEEATQLENKLSQLSGQFDAQILVMTVSSTEDTIDAYVETVYDSLEMGYGDSRDGVLLLVCMDLREYRILSNGYAAQAIGPNEIDAISDQIASYLSNEAYADAFSVFADRCAYYLDGYLNGFPFNVGKNLIVALIVGIGAGVVVALVLKGQLKSVRQQKKANVYIKNGSMQITTSRDLFLYRQVSRTKKETSESSNSGSSRNVGGGSF